MLAAGDIAWAVLDPVLGTEQAGRRPALILTDGDYNARSTRVVICPISKRARDWPFEVHLPRGLKTAGVVLVDQVRTVDQSQRLFHIVESVPPELLDEVRGRLAVLLGIRFAA